MTPNVLLRQLEGHFGSFPQNYLVLDIETSGFDQASDLILSIGHVIVEGGKVVDHLDAFLDWSRPGLVDWGWLVDRMAKTRYNMGRRGREYKMCPADLQSRGGHPVEVLRGYLDLIRGHQRVGDAFVMHNGYLFDAPRLSSHFQKWLGEDLQFGPGEIWDTAAFEKALQVGVAPDPRESMRSWSKRVAGARTKGVTWALDSHCVPKYDLVRKFNLDESQAHGSGYDAYVTHLLFETYREIAASAVVPVPEAAGPSGSSAHAVVPGQPDAWGGRSPYSDRRGWGDDDPGGRYGHLG